MQGNRTGLQGRLDFLYPEAGSLILLRISELFFIWVGMQRRALDVKGFELATNAEIETIRPLQQYS